MPADFIKVATFANKMGVTRNHIYDLINEGKIECELVDGIRHIDYSRYKDMDVFAAREGADWDLEKLRKMFRMMQRRVNEIEKRIGLKGEEVVVQTPASPM